MKLRDSKVAPASTVTEALPSAEALAIAKVPCVTVIFPVPLFAPERTSVETASGATIVGIVSVPLKTIGRVKFASGCLVVSRPPLKVGVTLVAPRVAAIASKVACPLNVAV